MKVLAKLTAAVCYKILQFYTETFSVGPFIINDLQPAVIDK
jgi:hypothetical protein